jgi:hypothetical protein
MVSIVSFNSVIVVITSSSIIVIVTASSFTTATDIVIVITTSFKGFGDITDIYFTSKIIITQPF